MFHKDKIVHMLIKHLSVEGSLAIAPLLEYEPYWPSYFLPFPMCFILSTNCSHPTLTLRTSLVATLSRDLRHEVYPFFADIYACLQRLLLGAGPDAVLIENIFSCLSYLFKFLQKQVRAYFPIAIIISLIFL